ncbi:MAG TPA: PDZ domain-containing protein [Phycisphaerales bacterium]|nr:PDZ domain-containing protein [Phycisphaerales bacterium]
MIGGRDLRLAGACAWGILMLGVAVALTPHMARAQSPRPTEASGQPAETPANPTSKESTGRPTRQHTQDEAEQIRRRAMKLEAEAVKAFLEKRFEDAEKALREQLELQPDNYVILYNLACARSALGDAKEGIDFLVRSVEGGFDDVRQLERDPSLALLRADPQYKKMITVWPEVLKARRDANVESVREFFRGRYEVLEDERLRLVYVSAVNEHSLTRAREEISKIGEWASREIFPGMLENPQAQLDPWVVVVLPTREDFVRWIVSRHGPDAVTGMSSIGGEYDHDTKILVAQDLGSSLRHEFFHVLHWRSCMRLGQRHPIWIQEGLCSIVEDYEPRGADIQPVSSWRTNIVKRIERSGGYRGLEDLCNLDANKFMGTRVLAMYARARAAFLYLSELGMLGRWYQNYVDDYHTDPSGLKTWERTLEKPVKQIDLDMRGWIRRMEMVPEQIKSGMASLGVEVEAADGDGLRVAGLLEDHLRRGGPLIPGDIIVDIDGRATRDIAELVRVLGTYQPGTKVNVGVRRRSGVRTIEITLVAKK